VIDNVRDRALILLLLRTGIRIGEALGLRLNDLDVQDRKVHLFEGKKEQYGQGSLSERTTPNIIRKIRICYVQLARCNASERKRKRPYLLFIS